MSRFFFDSAAATPITATMRNRWTGLNSSQATASSRLKPPPTALAELASSALTSLPWRDTQAIRFGGAGTGQLCCAKPPVESRRGDGEENGARDTRAGGKAAWAAKPKPRSSSAASSMNEERDQEERDWSDRFIGFEGRFWQFVFCASFLNWDLRGKAQNMEGERWLLQHVLAYYFYLIH